MEGFSSLSYDDVKSKISYMSHLPLIAECLPYDCFIAEVNKIIQSISKNIKLLYSFSSILGSVIEKIGKEHVIEFCYFIGSKVYDSSDSINSPLLEKTLNHELDSLNNLSEEKEKYIIPALEMKQGFNQFIGLRAILISKTDSNLIEKVFNETNLIVSAPLGYHLNKNQMIEVLPMFLKNKSPTVRKLVVSLIMKYGIENNDSITEFILNEQDPIIRVEILKLPLAFIPSDFIDAMINKSPIPKEIVEFIISNSLFEKLDNKDLMEVALEMNHINLELLICAKEIPFSLLIAILHNSKELLLEKTIDMIIRIDSIQIWDNILYPTMSFKGPWRVHYNSVLIFKSLIQKMQLLSMRESQIIEYFQFYVYYPSCRVREALFHAIGQMETKYRLDDLFKYIADEIFREQVINQFQRECPKY